MANNFPTEYGTSPVGKLISGDPFQKQTKDMDGRDIPLDKQGYWFAIAAEKNAPGVNDMLGTLNKAARAGYMNAPHIMAQIEQGLNAQQFSWKVSDGDEMIVDPKTGERRLRWSHGANCWIIKFSTTLPIQAAMYEPNASVPTPCSQEQIYRGAYVQVSYGTSINGNQDKTAGVYVNPRTVAFVFHGDPIVSGPSMEQQFTGGTGGYRPAGASDSPMAPSGNQNNGGMNNGGNNGGMNNGGNNGGMNGGNNGGMNGGGMGGMGNNGNKNNGNQNNGGGMGGMGGQNDGNQNGGNHNNGGGMGGMGNQNNNGNQNGGNQNNGGGMGGMGGQNNGNQNGGNQNNGGGMGGMGGQNDGNQNGGNHNNGGGMGGMGNGDNQQTHGNGGNGQNTGTSSHTNGMPGMNGGGNQNNNGGGNQNNNGGGYGGYMNNG